MRERILVFRKAAIIATTKTAILTGGLALFLSHSRARIIEGEHKKVDLEKARKKENGPPSLVAPANQWQFIANEGQKFIMSLPERGEHITARLSIP